MGTIWPLFSGGHWSNSTFSRIIMGKRWRWKRHNVKQELDWKKKYVYVKKKAMGYIFLSNWFIQFYPTRFFYFLLCTAVFSSKWSYQILDSCRKWLELDDLVSLLSSLFYHFLFDCLMAYSSETKLHFRIEFNGQFVSGWLVACSSGAHRAVSEQA